MAETNINIQIDEGLKQNFDSLRQQKIPFEISLDIPNAETIEAIKEVQEMKKNLSLGKTYMNVEEMIKEVLYIWE